MKLSSLSLVFVALTSTALAVNAGPAGKHLKHTHGVSKREVNQEERIAQGVKSGELTKAEAKKLQGEEKALRTEKRAYKADGVVTPAERKDLHQDANQASKDIYAEKHDAEVRAKK